MIGIKIDCNNTITETYIMLSDSSQDNDNNFYGMYYVLNKPYKIELWRDCGITSWQRNIEGSSRIRKFLKCIS